ncbi:MAG: hypothetical protein Q9188_007488 [Gyalolechia gomerana]
MGKAGKGGGVWLLPEEVLYLVERGSLDVRYTGDPERGGRGEVEDLGEDGEVGGAHGWDDVSLSLQACYAWFIGRDGLSLERYIVYAGLRRSGYIVLRAPGWYEDEEESQGRADITIHQMQQQKDQTFSIWQWIHKNFLERKPRDPPPLGPLVGPGLYRSYSDIYRLLNLIPYHDPSQPTTTSTPLSPCSSTPSAKPPFLRPHFHIYKPTPNFRKTAPGSPDFHLTVLSAREDNFPTLSQLDGLLQSVPYAPPPETETRSYQRLKHGYRNVVLAIVDQGVVSYMRVADAGFGLEKMYERGAGRSGQGKRGGGGRGGRGNGGKRGRGSKPSEDRGFGDVDLPSSIDVRPMVEAEEERICSDGFAVSTVTFKRQGALSDN